MNADEKVNILLVDDQPAKLISYKAILSELGETLVCATSGREALEHLLKSSFAVILIDVCMPEQDGFELAEMIRAHHRFSKTAIIFVSAIQMTDIDRARGYASGAVDYVSVPIVPEILRAKVAVFVDLFRKTRQLERMNIELEERVLERTSQLETIQNSLRETDRRKDVFLATLAHELRNPLAPMRSALELLQSSGPDASVTSYATDVLDRQLSQMTRLIDDLLDLSRISRNSLELRIEMFEVSSVFEGAVETAMPLIDAAGQTLHVMRPKERIYIEADKARVAQMISNLLNNASKYTPHGGAIHIVVSVTDQDLIVKVRDSGIGLAEDQIARVFDPFYQVEVGPGFQNSGLGLGLTLVQTLAELHGGTISVTSEGLGRGSEFCVTLPCRPAVQTVESIKAGEPGQPEPPRQRHRILVVDDNVDAAESLAMLLEHMGNEVILVHDGLAALHSVECDHPEIVIMDIGMPIMDGYQAVREMYDRGIVNGTTLVALTGWGQEEDKRKTREAGFHHHLVKPVPLSSLQELLSSIKSRD